MSTILTERLPAPYAGAPVVTRAARPFWHRTIRPSAILEAIWREVAEWLALAWMFGCVAFSLLMMAGVTGLLG